MQIVFLRQPHKFIKKADKNLKNKLYSEVSNILANPKIGKILGGKLLGMLSHHFNFTGVSYRIAYKLKDDLIVIHITTRENFYRDLQI